MYPVINGSTRKSNACYAVLCGITRKIKAGYVVQGGVNRQFFSAVPPVTVTYSGTHTVSDVTVSGKTYKLYALTGSGTLTIEGGEVQYWMCGGGASGMSAYVSSGDKGKNDNSGVGGSGGYIDHGTLAVGTHTVTIGAGGELARYGTQHAGGATSIGTHTANGATTNGQSGPNDPMVINGASGGGGAVSYEDHRLASTTYGYYKPSKGSGYANTYPFFSADLSSIGAHCAGGGGGGFYYEVNSKDHAIGGNGGEMGGDGAVVTSQTRGTPSGEIVNGGTGGQKGGGLGGYGDYGMYTKSYINGYAATFYGSGGGGGGYYYYSSSLNYNGNGGAGYQGVAYILVPA